MTVGRRAGNPDTRAEILDAAREVFGESGFDRATIRDIAARAGVDPALVHHYFGTKGNLFAASIELPVSPGEALSASLTDDSGAAGERLAALFFSIWETEEARSSLLGILRTAIAGEERGVAAFREFLVDEIRGRIAPRIAHEDAELRALAVASHLVGMAVVRYVVRVEPLASAPVDDLVALVAPRLQSYLD